MTENELEKILINQMKINRKLIKLVSDILTELDLKTGQRNDQKIAIRKMISEGQEILGPQNWGG